MLYTMQNTLTGRYDPAYIARHTYLEPLFVAVRECVKIECSAGDNEDETTYFCATVAILRPEDYERLLAAERELYMLKQLGGENELT